MGQSTTLTIRKQIVELKQSGKKHLEVSDSLGISQETSKSIWKRYKLEGDHCLVAKYKNCGRTISESEEKNFRLVRFLKQLHPDWGIKFICMKIEEKFSHLKLRSVRQYQSRLSKDKLHKSKLPIAENAERAKFPHDTWQIDAKERVKLLDGTEVCYITVVDEASGAILATRVFPPRISQ
jgi:transposase